MNSSFASICVLMKSNLGERCLINTLMNMTSQALRFYLKHANIYDGNSNKKKTRVSSNDSLWMHYKSNK